jgi:hypothetical protein
MPSVPSGTTLRPPARNVPRRGFFCAAGCLWEFRFQPPGSPCRYNDRRSVRRRRLSPGGCPARRGFFMRGHRRGDVAAVGAGELRGVVASLAGIARWQDFHRAISLRPAASGSLPAFSAPLLGTLRRLIRQHRLDLHRHRRTLAARQVARLWEFPSTARAACVLARPARTYLISASER